MILTFRAGDFALLSQTAEYALRAIVCLAENPKQPKTSQQIAERTKVPSGYLSKVLQSLGRSGLVRSQRGLHGGFVLADDPKKMTVLDVVSAVDPIRRIESCPLGLESHGKNLCPLHRKLDDAMAEIESAFGSATLSDLLNDPNRNTPLCEMPNKRTTKR